MTRLLLIAALGLCLAAGVVRADEAATDRLIEQLQKIRQLQGKFEQQQYAAGTSERVGTSSGHFKLLRPGYFAWDISSPDSQLIVADLDYLWHFDRDLETVTRRPVTGREEISPLQVLGGDTALLREEYDVTMEEGQRYRLSPRGGNPGFKSLLLQLHDGQLAGMEILDNLDQRLVITFADVDDHSPLTPRDFSFVPPEGADVFYHGQ